MQQMAKFRVIIGLLVFAAGTVQAGEPPTSPEVRGKALFEHRCGMCHLAGPGHTGTEVLQRRLGPERALLTNRTDLTPAYVRQVVRWGLVNMPRLSRVEMPDADLNDVIAYLNAPKPAP